MLVLLSAFTGCMGNRAQPELQDAGGAHLFIYRARVIEVVSEYSFIAEILPSIIQGEEYSWTEREGKDRLVVGDIVKAVYSVNSYDFERAVEFIARINVDDIVNISYFNRANLSFDYYAIPIVVDCDGIDIYDTDGRTVMEYF